MASAEGGADLVVVREKDLPVRERQGLAARLHALLAPRGVRVLLAGSPGPDGCHLPSGAPWPRGAGAEGVRGAAGAGGGVGTGAGTPLVGRSCHDARQVAAAAGHGADYVTLSPVFPTLSKPGYGPALGVEALAGPWPVPVYALGGVVSPGQARGCVAAGAAGVAVMGAVMRAQDPAALTRALVEAVGG